MWISSLYGPYRNHPLGLECSFMTQKASSNAVARHSEPQLLAHSFLSRLCFLVLFLVHRQYVSIMHRLACLLAAEQLLCCVMSAHQGPWAADELDRLKDAATRNLAMRREFEVGPVLDTSDRLHCVVVSLFPYLALRLSVRESYACLQAAGMGNAGPCEGEGTASNLGGTGLRFVQVSRELQTSELPLLPPQVLLFLPKSQPTTAHKSVHKWVQAGARHILDGINWNWVALQVGTRSPTQCRQAW
jgi:hypothetical protein